MTEFIDHATEAWSTWENAIDRGHPDAVDNPAHESLLHMLHALVEQQRIANLIALTVPDGDAREVREIAIEGVKIDARGRMRHDSRVWYEALESALDALLPAFWDKATASALSRAAAPDLHEASNPYLSPEEVQTLPVGSVVMTETDPEVFGVYEQRVWQRFGGVPDWQFKSPRHEWQSTDGGFQRVEDRDWPPIFTGNRRVRLLYTPGPLPVGVSGALPVVLSEGGERGATHDEPLHAASNDDGGEPDGQVGHDRVEHAGQSTERLPVGGEQ